jgi:hypothetical protein
VATLWQKPSPQPIAPVIETQKPEYSYLVEAENVVFNVRLEQKLQGGNLIGFVQFGQRASEYIEWQVDVPRTGRYRITFFYSLMAGEASGTLVPTQGLRPTDPNPPQVKFPSTGKSTTWARTSALTYLNQGDNALRLTCQDPPSLRLDWIRIDGPFAEP